MPVFSDGQKISASLAWDRLIESIPASYVIWKDGDIYRAECLMKGGTDYSGSDAATVIQSAVDALKNSYGTYMGLIGKIFFKAGDYELKTPLNLTKTYNVYLTRNDDTYLPLRQRTEYAIQRKADLFISLHVNSCNNPQVFGVETYYLSLASDESAERTAAMENAVAEKSINDFESLLTKILKDTKVEESCKLAELVQENIVNTINSNDRLSLIHI